jgi:Dimerisation domain
MWGSGGRAPAVIVGAMTVDRAAHQPPPPVQIVLLLGGFRISQALYAAAVLGVGDQLVAGPEPVEVLAERSGAHPPSLYRLLRTLASVGVFTEPGPGVFALTPLAQMLTTSQPGSMRDLASMFMETHYAPFGDLLHTIRTGQPAAEYLYGQPFFGWLSDHPEQASRYTAAMANLTGAFKPAAIAALPLDGAQSIVDLGGADGSASWPTSPRPAASARGCWCLTSWCRPATLRTWPRSPT